MAGYGPEDDHFVVELTYNYGIKEYKIGNDFQVDTCHMVIMIPSKVILQKYALLTSIN